MLSTAAMTTDNPFQLVFRLAQLETELRFTQERLSQEQAVNHYLLQQLASTASLPSLPAHPRTSTHADHLETSRNTAPHARPSQFREIVPDIEISADSGVISTSANASNDAELQTSKEDHARVMQSEHPNDSKATLQHAPHITTSSGKAFDQSSQHHERKDSATDLGQVQGFARPDARDKQDSRPTYLGSCVHFEYHRLLGAACFIEDMDADGKAAHWRKFARNFPLASAAQWESYYESDVRPVYLEKQRAREQIVVLPSRTELDNRGHALSTDAEKLTSDERAGSTRQSPPDLKVDAPLPENTHNVEIEEPIPNLIDFDDGDDKVDAQVQPVLDAEVKQPPAPSSTQAPPSPAQALPSSAQALPSSAQALPSSAQAPPSSTQAPPSSTQAPPSLTQPAPSSTPAPPSYPQAPPSSTQASPPTRPRWSPPPLEVEQLLYQPSTHVQHPHRTALITNIPPGLTTHEALTNLEQSDIISATHLWTSGMRLKNGVIDTDTILIVFNSGERLRELIEQCDGKWPIVSPGQSDGGTATISIVETATHPGLLAAKRFERPHRQDYRVVERCAY